ncbi:DUF6907 domain-containing protein [Streptomyces virginiae]|uniref:DUF6907 domain-containing protein n=1 Tax=Streptomyces virginiae TaxID=1961 RepID=UPI002254C6B4|nr:hypothetical protein [Streptomyces virginiae]MCX5270967.1 hypothetical protein [Streptomyces virginiae]
MSSTVPADLPRMFRPEPKLAAVPTQPTAKTREAIELEAAQRSVDAQFPLVAELVAEPAPRTWSFIDSTTSKLQEVTCLAGCVVNHGIDRETPTHPYDIWCCTKSEEVFLPIVSGGEDVQELRVLSAFIRQEPFSRNLHERVPHAQVEVVDDNFIEGLDPDGLATVILTLEAQLAGFRKVHAQLVELREQGRVEL